MKALIRRCQPGPAHLPNIHALFPAAVKQPRSATFAAADTLHTTEMSMSHSVVEARLSQDGSVRCGIRNCRGRFGRADSVPIVMPTGEQADFDRSIAIAPIFVHHGTGDDALWEEPPSRTGARMRGQSSQHHYVRPSRAVGPDGVPGRVQDLPAAVLRETDLPARIRCPRCARISWLTVRQLPA